LNAPILPSLLCFSYTASKKKELRSHRTSDNLLQKIK